MHFDCHSDVRSDPDAAGDITRMGHTIAFAWADGVMAALATHRSFGFAEVA